MRPITNMKPAKNVNNGDACEVAREFEKRAGLQITVRVFNWEGYTTITFQGNINQIVDVELPARDVGGDQFADLKRLVMTQGMATFMGGLSTPLLRCHGKKLS